VAGAGLTPFDAFGAGDRFMSSMCQSAFGFWRILSSRLSAVFVNIVPPVVLASEVAKAVRT
jgi:hypothetical protein